MAQQTHLSVLERSPVVSQKALEYSLDTDMECSMFLPVAGLNVDVWTFPANSCLGLRLYLPKAHISVRVLVVEGTDVKGGVSRGVLSSHVGSVKQQVLQVLNMTMTACLVYLLPAVLVHTAHLSVVVEQKFTAVGVSSYHRAVIKRT